MPSILATTSDFSLANCTFWDKRLNYQGFAVELLAMQFAAGLHSRVDILEDHKGLTPHPDILLGNDLRNKSVLTSRISPYSSKRLKRVSLSSSIGTFSLRLLTYKVLLGAC